jgi:hypothetical protein
MFENQHLVLLKSEFAGEISGNIYNLAVGRLLARRETGRLVPHEFGQIPVFVHVIQKLAGHIFQIQALVG